MDHPFFSDFDWKSLEEKRIKPNFTPNVKNVFEYLKSITEEDSDVEELAKQNANDPASRDLLKRLVCELEDMPTEQVALELKQVEATLGDESQQFKFGLAEVNTDD